MTISKTYGTAVFSPVLIFAPSEAGEVFLTFTIVGICYLSW